MTRFVRDPEVFDALKPTVFPALLAQKQEAPIGIWVPGCSTGEEVYSLAMCLLEHLGEASRPIEFQILVPGGQRRPGGRRRRNQGVSSRSMLQVYAIVPLAKAPSV